MQLRILGTAMSRGMMTTTPTPFTYYTATSTLSFPPTPASYFNCCRLSRSFLKYALALMAQQQQEHNVPTRLIIKRLTDRLLVLVYCHPLPSKRVLFPDTTNLILNQKCDEIEIATKAHVIKSMQDEGYYYNCIKKIYFIINQKSKNLTAKERKKKY